MIVGSYVLQLYCQEDNPEHGRDEFPHEYTAEFGAACRKAARQEGWILNLKEHTAICPKCKEKSDEIRT